MSEQTTIEQTATEPEVAPVRGDTTYVVQVREARAVDGNGTPLHDGPSWRDIATVTVPQRTPRKIVFRKALEASGLRPAPDSEPLRLRALDAASAAERPVEPFQPEPEWRVG